MNLNERNQIARILQDYVARTYSPDNTQRDFYEGLIEEWRKTGKAGSGSLERDAFLELVALAIS